MESGSVEEHYKRNVGIPFLEHTILQIKTRFVPENRVGQAVFALLSDHIFSCDLDFVCLFVCGISLTSGQLFNELFPDCTRSCFSQVVLRPRGGDRIYEMRCLFVAVGPNARFIVLPHWDNMSQAHMIPHPVTLY